MRCSSPTPLSPISLHGYAAAVALATALLALSLALLAVTLTGPQREVVRALDGWNLLLTGNLRAALVFSMPLAGWLAAVVAYFQLAPARVLARAALRHTHRPPELTALLAEPVREQSESPNPPQIYKPFQDALREDGVVPKLSRHAPTAGLQARSTNICNEVDEMPKHQMAAIALATAGSLAACDASHPAQGRSYFPLERPDKSSESARPPAPTESNTATRSSQPQDLPAIIRKVMDQQYGKSYDPTLDCWRLDVDLAEGGTISYCMKPTEPQIVDAGESKDVYFLATSLPSADDPSYNYGQSDPGLMGAFLIRLTSSQQWKLLAASKDMDFGWAGDCDCRSAEFVEIGPDYYGWSFSSGGVWHGVAVYNHAIVAAHEGKFVDLSAIPKITEDNQSLEYEIAFDRSSNSRPAFPLIVSARKAGSTTVLHRVDFDSTRWLYAFPTP